MNVNGTDHDSKVEEWRNPSTVFGETKKDRMHQIQVDRDAISMRQSTEWGMRAIKPIFPQWKIALYIMKMERERQIWKWLYYCIMVDNNQRSNMHMSA